MYLVCSISRTKCIAVRIRGICEEWKLLTYMEAVSRDATVCFDIVK